MDFNQALLLTIMNACISAVISIASVSRNSGFEKIVFTVALIFSSIALLEIILWSSLQYDEIKILETSILLTFLSIIFVSAGVGVKLWSK